jgi:hypothetical protein
MQVLFTAPKPAISPLELIPVANNRNKGEFAGTSAFRSLIRPPCQRNARGFPSLSNDAPTTSRLSLIPTPPLARSPGSVPRSAYLCRKDSQIGPTKAVFTGHIGASRGGNRDRRRVHRKHTYDGNGKGRQRHREGEEGRVPAMGAYPKAQLRRQADAERRDAEMMGTRQGLTIQT